MYRFGLLCVLMLPEVAIGQSPRYELGKRVVQFEAAWNRTPDADGRARALKDLPQITPLFFSLKFGEAGRTLDTARHRLTSATPPSLAVQWLEALACDPGPRLLAAATVVTVDVRPFYPVKSDVPNTASVSLAIDDGPPVAVPLGKLPSRVVVPLPSVGDAPRDFTLRFVGKLGKDTVFDRATTLTVAPKIVEQLAAWKRFAAVSPGTIESATVADRAEFLQDVLDGTAPEADFPLAKLLTEGDGLTRSEPTFTSEKSGQFTLSVPLAKKRTAVVRLFVPKNLSRAKPVPLVFALHGAGGSENMFFEAYGAGQIVRECETRGWLLVAPRSGLGFASGPPVDVILGELGKRYPIDAKHVFIVGHSMGAAQTIAAVQAHPNLFAGAAALGGGGRVTEAKAFATVPLFVGVGDRDFALSGAKALAKAVPGAKFQEYPGLEHMVIVREALPDVFRGWDSIVQGAK